MAQKKVVTPPGGGTLGFSSKSLENDLSGVSDELAKIVGDKFAKEIDDEIIFGTGTETNGVYMVESDGGDLLKVEPVVEYKKPKSKALTKKELQDMVENQQIVIDSISQTLEDMTAKFQNLMVDFINEKVEISALKATVASLESKNTLLEGKLQMANGYLGNVWDAVSGIKNAVALLPGYKPVI